MNFSNMPMIATASFGLAGVVGAELKRLGMQEVKGEIDTRLKSLAGEGEAVTVFNTLGFDRDDVVRLGDVSASALKDADGTVYPVQQTADGAVAYIKGIPSKGYKALTTVEAQAASPFTRSDAYHLETPFYSIALDATGAFTSIFDKENDREVLKPGQVARIRCYEDKPIYYDNWDIDMYYTEKSWAVDELKSLRWIADGAVETVLELVFDCCGSEILQKIHFYADTRRIDFETKIDWKLHQHLLKAEFPVDIHADEATFEVQFGNVKRKTHTNTSWDKARFESCAQKWMDFSEGHYGVSLLNDCKYGHSVNDGVIGLTLLKSGVEPHPNADVEVHEFTYSLLPHAESWQQAGTVQEAYKLNQSAYAVIGGEAGKTASFASVNKRNVILETVKAAENGEGTVLRLYECENARTKVTVTLPESTKAAYLTNLLEEIESELDVVNNAVTFTIKPYEIITVLVK